MPNITAANILLLALGSRGDVTPYVTLAGALQQAGNRVRVATFGYFREMVEAAGLELLPVQGDAEDLLRQAADGMLDASAPALANPLAILRTFRALQRSYGQLARHLPQVLDDPRLLDTDLVLNQLPAYLFGEDMAEMLAQRTGRRVPWAIVSVIPLSRSIHRPLPGFGSLPPWASEGLRRVYNLWTYRTGEQIGWQMFRRAVNRWRCSQGMRPQPFWGRYDANFSPPAAGEADLRPPILCGFSELVSPRPPDWGNHISLTGWWWPPDTRWFEPQAPWPLPPKYANPALEQFIAAGAPPVFVGLGSMPAPDPARTSALLIESARLAGARLVLHSGWAGLSVPPEMAERVFCISYAPYDWLFPQMSLVIHHGGSGTTGYALASGVPSMALPFVFDQFFWGERSAALGVGPAPIPFTRLSVRALAEAIRQAQQSGAFQPAAAALAKRLRAENGLQRAVAQVNQIIVDN